MKVLTLATRGRDLTRDLAESLDVLEQYGQEWAAEIFRAREQCRAPNGILVRPDDLPNDLRLLRIHRDLDEHLRRRLPKPTCRIEEILI